MKTAWMVGLMLAAGMIVRAEETKPAVTVYVSSDAAVPAVVLENAQLAAGKIFNRIGVKVLWQKGRPRPNAVDRAASSVAVCLETAVPAKFRTGALAFTNPEKDGVIIHIFYRRVAAAYRRDLAPVLLGYVLAHEIAHVLQGASRHSEEGIMKPRWTPADYQEMAAMRLDFSPLDVTLIHRRMAAAAAEFALTEP